MESAIIPKKTAEYGIYHFIDQYPALPYVLIGAIRFIMGWDDLEATFHLFSSIVLFVALAVTIGVILKAIFRTPRRVPRYGNSPVKYGFPSIHSMLSAGSIGMVYFINPLALVIMIPLAALYIYSRIAIGVHSVTDVVGGAILGFLIGLSTRSIKEPQE